MRSSPASATSSPDDRSGVRPSGVGTVFEIQRMSTEDGPGIRTTVFMKGCPMRCLWCHNPEGIAPKPHAQWISQRCIGCRSCRDICSSDALHLSADAVTVDPSRCTGCGLCVDVCPTTALEMVGRSWHVEELVAELLKDRVYFDRSGGGVTISGGESTLQWPFVSDLLRRLHQEGIHCSIDTCGIASRQALDAILPHADLLLYDVKEMDPVLHQEFTQCDAAAVQENLRYCIEQFSSSDREDQRIWIRTPLIPGATARSENIRQIGAFLAGLGTDRITRWDLLAFNNLCEDKYRRLGWEWPYRHVGAQSNDELRELILTARTSGVAPDLVRCSRIVPDIPDQPATIGTSDESTDKEVLV